MTPIDLRSDTVTRPTDAMLDRMRNAELGDDSRDGDPTVQMLEARAAARAGKDAGLFVSSGTMGNLVALLAHTGRGAEVSEVFHDAGGVFHRAGTANRVPGPAPEHKSYGSWVSFADPDGNTWYVQEVTTRLPGRPVSALAAFGSVAALAEALRRAEAAHGQHEKEIGHSDPDWPDWYADYMAAEQSGKPLPL